MGVLQVASFLVLVLPAMSAAAYMIDETRTSYQPYSQAWQEFQEKYGVSYTGEENSTRYQVFEARVQRVEAHNQRFQDNQETYTMGITQFTDDLEDELDSQCFTGGDMQGAEFCSTFQVPTNIEWPNTRVYNRTDALDQGKCGSCYAFASASAIASQLRMNPKQHDLVSEQQLVDCSRPDGAGCEGGLPHETFHYIYNFGGIINATAYPYSAKTKDQGVPGTCAFEAHREKIVAKVLGCYMASGEDNLKYMVAYLGPVVVGFAVTESFRQYDSRANGGVYQDSSCPQNTNNLTHAMTVYGYDTHAKYGDYWLVKNSWGSGWGMNGYARIARGKNVCGIGNYLVVPLVQNYTIPLPINKEQEASSSASAPSGCFVIMPVVVLLAAFHAVSRLLARN